MDNTATKKPKTMAELLPGLGGLLTKDSIQTITLTATKKPRQTIANTRTSEKVIKPMTIAEMRNEICSLQLYSPETNVQTTASVKKKWNSSSKLENKLVSHTGNGQMKHKSVRKVLNFQLPKPRPPKVTPKTFPYKRMTVMNSETPKFQKPEIKLNKTVLSQARNTIRISGICNIPETPVIVNKPMKSRMTLANKENIPYQPKINMKLTATPKSTLRKKVLTSRVPDTPLSNGSWKSSCDASFLQNEQEIEYIESKSKALADEVTLDKIAEVSPPMSTPFTDYRNVKDFFEHSTVEQNSNDTIMCFDNTVSKENSKREESVIVSLCDMLNKATVSTEKHSMELEDLLEMQKQTESNLKMIENGIKTLNKIKESQLKSLQYVKKLIHKKKSHDVDKKETVAAKESPKYEPLQTDQCSVIITPPSYKVPKKYTCMKKKVFHKSLPNIPQITPQKEMGEKALSMYLKMKEHNNYLNTPVVKPRMGIPDTPAMTSHNLQKQLDKLYHQVDTNLKSP